MVELYESECLSDTRQSSKGNQLKWKNGDTWYKADYTGYEGLSEYVISELLRFSDLQPNEYILYRTEEIRYNSVIYRGCTSENFLPEGWQMYTLERLFKHCYNESLYEKIYQISNVSERIRFLVEQTERMTGLKDFGAYMSKIFTLDALFLNEDRHTHNIAVIMDPGRKFHFCPFFDHGAALLADTAMDYPIGIDIYDLIAKVNAKTVSKDFDEQLDIAEKLYGQQIHFSFTKNDITDILAQERYYPRETKDRVVTVIREQIRKYSYLFSG